jgi:predicted peptidase
LNYRVLEPADQSTPQPLLLFLHGSGSRGDDNVAQLRGLPSQLIESEWRQRCPGFVLAPQCPPGSDWQRELPALISLLDVWRNDPRVDRRRVYVTGLSMGGFGTWHLIAAKPDWLAAAVPICGGGDPDTAAKLLPVPIWAVHGHEDKVVPPDQSRQMIDALRAAGGDPKYTQLPDVGHNCWTQAYRDPDGVLHWMHSQAK